MGPVLKTKYKYFYRFELNIIIFSSKITYTHTIWLNFSIFSIIFYSTIIILLTNIILLKNLYKPASSTSIYNIYLKPFISNIITHIYYSFGAVFLICYPYIKNILYKKIHYAEWLLDFIEYLGGYCYFLAFILPRLLIALALFIDIVIFNYMYYLYWIIWLIWIPVLLKVFLYIILYWANIFKAHLLKNFEIKVEFHGRVPIIS